jgi:hypothetical protein
LVDSDARADLASPRSPFFSPDGRSIGFFEGSELKKVSIGGGPAMTLSRLTGTNGRGASWGDDNTITFATADLATGLMRVAASGGQPKPLTTPEQPIQEGDHLFPSVLPNNRGVLFTIVPPGGSQIDSSQVAVIDLKTGEKKTLIRGGSQAAYVESATRVGGFPWLRWARSTTSGPGGVGYLVYAAAGTLRAARFDLDRLEVAGDPVPVVEHVAMAATGAANFAVSRQGTLVYVPGSGVSATTTRSLAWVNRQGREKAIDAPPRAYTVARLSPDGTRIALDIRDQENDIWVWHLGRRTLTRLTFDAGTDTEPVWSPDGRRIIFSSTRSGAPNLYVQSADGTGVVERLTTSPTAQYATSITPDGKDLLGYEVTSTGPDVVLFHLDAPAKAVGRPAEPLVKTSFVEVLPEFSPDGRYVAYFSNESGRFEVYVRPFPKIEEGRWQVSTSGGTRPVWARNGRELLFLDGLSALTAVPVDTSGATFSAGNPSKVLEARYFALPGPRPYDVTSDGQRFLMIKNTATAADEKTNPASLIVVEHWLEELQQRVPGK